MTQGLLEKIGEREHWLKKHRIDKDNNVFYENYCKCRNNVTTETRKA